MTLEGGYRRLSRLFPAAWRERNEEELIGTLLDAAEPGRHRVSLAEAADLVRAALVLHVRARGRLAGPVALAVVSALAVVAAARSASSRTWWRRCSACPGSCRPARWRSRRSGGRALPTWSGWACRCSATTASSWTSSAPRPTRPGWWCAGQFW